MEETRYTFARRKQTLNRIEHLYAQAIEGPGPRRRVAYAAGTLAIIISLVSMMELRRATFGVDNSIPLASAWVLMTIVLGIFVHMAVVFYAAKLQRSARDKMLQLLISYDPLNEEAFGDLQRVVDGEGNIAQVDMAQWLLAERKALSAVGRHIQPPINPLAHQLRKIDRS